MLSSFFIALLIFIETSLGCKYKFIHNASELIEFSYETNKGTTYNRYTVYLVADINFDQNLSQKFIPISKLLGVFDGQGYVIRNLTFSSASYSSVGLFGTIYKAQIKNLVIDRSCSFASSYRASGSSYGHVGGVVGKCSPSNGACVFENSVNMATLKFTGSISVYLWMGGIAGYIVIPSNNYVNKVLNCVNYGPIYNYGYSGSRSYVGGIVGECWGSNAAKLMYNSLNYGIVKKRLFRIRKLYCRTF